jgi:hypothetical protein
MPLQNRVSPCGELLVTAARGLLMGNRGGRLHRDDRTLGARRWASRQWICCRLEFNGRHRRVWGKGYSELFFLDDPSALAAGHRPCFECRRKDAENFAAAFATLSGRRIGAAEIDIRLHAERLDGRDKRIHRAPIDTLPDAAFVIIDDEPFAVRDDRLLRWTPSGYDKRRPRPRGIEASVLTPLSILTVLHGGYTPFWHPSATG